jgi:hypothetical protein
LFQKAIHLDPFSSGLQSLIVAKKAQHRVSTLVPQG